MDKVLNDRDDAYATQDSKFKSLSSPSDDPDSDNDKPLQVK